VFGHRYHGEDYAAFQQKENHNIHIMYNLKKYSCPAYQENVPAIKSTLPMTAEIEFGQYTNQSV
jgi:hypothetical protein